MSLPIIDLAPYLISKGSTKELALKIRDICKKTGFFYIKNHDVP
jgi:isopenicillin N synthase-like dioxygenase